jgi:hypothetical protein
MDGKKDKRQIPFGFLEMNRDLPVLPPQPEPVRPRQRKLTIPKGIRTIELFEEVTKPEHIKEFGEMIKKSGQVLLGQLALDLDREVIGDKGPSLEEAHGLMMQNVDEGTTCPCCGGHVQRYKRVLNSGMAASLCWLVKWVESVGDDGDGVCISEIHAPRFVTANRELGKLAHWGLVEEVSAAHWLPTAMGIAFAKGVAKVSRHVSLLNNVVQGWSEEKIGIREALGKKFDYEKLMRGEA